MIKVENIEIHGWVPTIRGMRNPLDSWAKSDTDETILEDYPEDPIIGENDVKLMWRLRQAGSDHAKFMRFITVTMDITAPLYWWKEFDTYKVGTVANSCSTMHTILTREITSEMFSFEHLTEESEIVTDILVKHLENLRQAAVRAQKNEDDNRFKELWYNIIQTMPASWNQRRTVQLNYEVLRRIYIARRHHKLQEWRDFCTETIEDMLPLAFLITGDEDDKDYYIKELNLWREEDDD